MLSLLDHCFQAMCEAMLVHQHRIEGRIALRRRRATDQADGLPLPLYSGMCRLLRRVQ